MKENSGGYLGVDCGLNSRKYDEESHVDWENVWVFSPFPYSVTGFFV